VHVALLVDDERLGSELAVINRLCVGLMAEGIRLTRILPDSERSHALTEEEARVGLARRLEIPLSVMPWARRNRARKLAEMIGTPEPDVILASGTAAWPLALDLGDELEKPAVLEIWSAAHLAHVPAPANAPSLGGFIVPTRAFAAALEHRVDPALVAMIPPGVALPQVQRQALDDPEKSAAIVILGSGRDLAAYKQVLGALPAVLERHPRTEIFMELRGPHEGAIWRMARELDLLSHLTALDDAARLRPLVTRADLLLVPERLGEMRTLILEAMAWSIPIVAAADPWLEMLAAGSAWLIEEESPDPWRVTLAALLDDPATARALGARGRAKVAQSHRSSDHVQRLIETLHRASRGEGYRMTP